jgi:hypothetical protein
MSSVYIEEGALHISLKCSETRRWWWEQLLLEEAAYTRIINYINVLELKNML